MNGTPPRFFALVLAGSRAGAADPMAAHCGVRHKALAPVGGLPMLARVLRTLDAAGPVAGVAVSAADPALPAEAARAAGRLRLEPAFLPSEASPSLSVARALAALADRLPLLLTTADHPLLTPAMVERFCEAVPPGADLAVGLARRSVIEAAYPETRRTYYRFAGDGYSGCNLFALMTPRARAAIDFWARVERERKRPWRLAALIGPGALLRYALGRLPLEAALAHLSRRVGATVKAVDMPFAEAAIDVDKPADLRLAEAILARRAAG